MREEGYLALGVAALGYQPALQALLAHAEAGCADRDADVRPGPVHQAVGYLAGGGLPNGPSGGTGGLRASNSSVSALRVESARADSVRTSRSAALQFSPVPGVRSRDHEPVEVVP
ncbi:hypothetical protein Val02_78130 [Virgisporangium aliadipatigenens]|uniref:Uncharacterized protein n=1 Tax=Virgisporangium aliadipatigenens TaxID=741659 RepID=A0A8J3YUI8_9ACTN|nr:hypothetical protein [Virgisporangium aliadipatigenens]GIJ50927.1 hypothetical protein Val02_78130 [Virgisporangium aliadipatigenens]